MRAAHAMPFGAEFRGRDTRFALWAPGCARVQLALGRDGRRRLDMEPGGDGWHSLAVDDVGPGEAYAFAVGEGKPLVPDPASRSNPWDVNAPSVVVDPRAFEWGDAGWRGRPWNEAVVYELHVGTFTGEGTYLAAIERLDYLADLGVTAIELMPLADFAGERNWGYDGVLLYAPDAAYGRPEDLKRLVAEAHKRGLMVLLDVVYNHFGPDGNYLSLYAPQFFNAAHQTPWGPAVNFDGEHCRTVRDFYVHNALYWLEEYRFDGVRMDAVHAIADDSGKHILVEIAEAIARGPGQQRHVHQVLENEHNEAWVLKRGDGPHATAQWNDDTHHGYHLLLTGETEGYYKDYADKPLWFLGRTLAEGFGFQGEPSRNRDGRPRGEPCTDLPPVAFVAFIQNHDQVGNRALGERISALAPPEGLRLASATLLLAPAIPLLFMGEEFAAGTPFLFFVDFDGDLAQAVREGRRKEFAGFSRFRDPKARESIPDPGDEATFLASKLRWEELERSPHREWHAHYRALLALRREHIIPRLGEQPARGAFAVHSERALSVDWEMSDGSRLHLRANFGPGTERVGAAPGRLIHVQGARPDPETLGPWSGAWSLEAA